MKFSEGDLVRLRHMIDAAEDARRFLDGKTLKELEQDRALALAVVK